jgi:hypothetical protein
VFCACEIIGFFLVVLCVARAVHNLDFRLVTKGKGDQRKGHSVIRIHVFERICMFYPTVIASVQEL